MISHLIRWAAGLAFLATSLGLVANAQPRGGHLIFGQEAGPLTLDPHFTTSIATRNVSMHVFEMLLTRDENNGIIKDLADDYSISDDGLTYTFKIRPGIRFHNGKELTSADVLGSFERYKRIGVGNALEPVETMEAPDPATFVIRLKSAVPLFLEEVSAFTIPIAIMPADQKDRPGGRNDMVGTGPYEFVEWLPDSHVRLRRFGPYVPDARYDASRGFGGRKVPNLDLITFRFMSDAVTRVAALETGEVHVVEDVPSKAAARLASNKAITLHPLKHWWLHGAWVNHVKPPTDNLLVRRAIQAALDMEEIMEVATDGAYHLQPGFQYPGNPYYVTNGAKLYNVNDPDRARKLLKESGYTGEPLVIITNSSFQSMYQAAVAVSQRLRDIGLNVRMDVFDWGTASSRLRTVEAWNLWFTGHGTATAVGPANAVRNMVSPRPNQFKPDPLLDDLYNQLLRGRSFDERRDTFARIQDRIYEQVLFLKFGDLSKIQASRREVKGFVPYRIPRFWNVSLEK